METYAKQSRLIVEEARRGIEKTAPAPKPSEPVPNFSNLRERLPPWKCKDQPLATKSLFYQSRITSQEQRWQWLDERLGRAQAPPLPSTSYQQPQQSSGEVSSLYAGFDFLQPVKPGQKVKPVYDSTRDPPTEAHTVVPSQPLTSQRQISQPERHPQSAPADPRAMSQSPQYPGYRLLEPREDREMSGATSQITQYPGYRLLEPKIDQVFVPPATSTSPKPGVGDQQSRFEQAHHVSDSMAFQDSDGPGRYGPNGRFKLSAQASGFVPGMPWAGTAEPSAKERYTREPFVPLQNNFDERPLSMIEPCNYGNNDPKYFQERRKRMREGASTPARAIALLQKSADASIVPKRVVA